MYHYRNKKTGAVVKTTCKIIGASWELVKAESVKPRSVEPSANSSGEKDATKADDNKPPQACGQG